jgi:hypothetical protein
MRVTRVLAIVATIAASLLSVGGTAGARTTPTVTLTATPRGIDIGQRPSFSYTTSGVSASATLILQRQFGTAGVWKRVASAAPASGTVSGAKLPALGRYHYRMVAKSTTGRVLATSKRNVVRVYDDIVLPSRNSPCDFATGCDGSIQVGDSIFTYTDGIGDPESMGYTGEYPNYAQSLYFKPPGTTCRSITLDFAGDEQQPGTTIFLKFVQESLDPVTSSTSTGEVGTVTVPLDGGPLNIDASYQVANGSHYEAVVFTVHGSCFTSDGLK